MNEKKKNMDIVSKMIIVGIVTVVVIIIAILAVSLSSRDKKSKTTIVDDAGTILLDSDKDDSKSNEPDQVVYERVLAVVKYVDIDKQELMIYDIENLKLVTLSVDSALDIKDAYGTDIALSQLELGDMIEAKYVASTKKPESLRVTAKTWERKDVSNMVVDAENKTITIANETYQYTQELVTSDDGVPFDILELNTADEAVVRGYKDYVWSIVLLNGHGTITLQNYDAFIGGEMEIDSRKSMPIVKDMTVQVSAGVRDIVISKDNMAPYVTQILVEEDKDVVIDLSEVQPKIGKVEFILMQDDVKVYLDDELQDLTQEIELDFGTYKVKAEKEGYALWESELTLNQAYLPFKIDLEKTAAKLYIQEPVGAEVYLDKQYVGLVPTDMPYQPGTHEVMLRKDGYHTFTQDFYWDNNEQDQYIVMPALTPLTQVEEKEKEQDAVIEGEDEQGDETQNPNPSPNSSNQVTN